MRPIIRFSQHNFEQGYLDGLLMLQILWWLLSFLSLAHVRFSRLAAFDQNREAAL
jgi:ABC-type transport system involved in multi-copper enzyme maturation permease subunit